MARELTRHDDASRRRGGASKGSQSGLAREVPVAPYVTCCIACGKDGKTKSMHKVGDRYQHCYICDHCWREIPL